MLVENLVLFALSVMWSHEPHINLYEYEDVTCFNSYYNGTN